MFERNKNKIVPFSVLSPFLPLVIIAGLLIGHGEKVKFSGNGSK